MEKRCLLASIHSTEVYYWFFSVFSGVSVAVNVTSVVRYSVNDNEQIASRNSIKLAIKKISHAPEERTERVSWSTLTCMCVTACTCIVMMRVCAVTNAHTPFVFVAKCQYQEAVYFELTSAHGGG